MATLQEIRTQYPQYGDMSDQQLADALYTKHYSDLPRADFDQKLGLQAAPAPVASPEAPSMAADVAKSAGIGLVNAGINTAGAVSDIASIGEAAGNAISPGAGNAVRAGLSAVPVIGALARGPGAGAITKAIEGVTGKFYTPKTTAGEYAKTTFEYAPGALLPGGMVARAANVLAPAVASETAGQLTKGTSAEPWARLAAGMTGGLAASGVGVSRARPDKAVPSIQKLKEGAGAAYKAAEDANVIIAPQSYGNAVRDIFTTAAKGGIDPTLHPRATAALKRLDELTGQPVTLETIDTLRQVVGAAADSTVKSERRLAYIMQDKLDDYVNSLKPSDVLAGDSGAAAAALTTARDMWARKSKSEVIERLIERAKNRAPQFGGSGYENALRTEFRSLAQNENRMRKFSAEERTAIQRVARGGPIENTLRNLGRLAPRGVVSGGVLGAGFWANPALGTAMLAAGEGGRAGATALTSRNAMRASEMMRRGGPAPRGDSVAADLIPNQLMPLLQADGTLTGNALMPRFEDVRR